MEPDKGTHARDAWEEELLAKHRWGAHADQATSEHHRLRTLWDALPPEDRPSNELVDQIVALEICNWSLEGSVLALCVAIGAGAPATIGIGHTNSVSRERWRTVWTYYLTLRNWLPCDGPSGCGALLSVCDPHGTIQEHILGLLGEHDRLKELYVERFCLCLEFWLGGCYSGDSSAQMKAHRAAVSAVDEEIDKRDAERVVVPSWAMALDGDGMLQPCHHKAFRRYDIILSSIGVGRWRACMPRQGNGSSERIATLETLLRPIEAWIEGKGATRSADAGDESFDRIHALLGQSSDVKTFLASLLASLLRAQQSNAESWPRRDLSS